MQQADTISIEALIHSASSATSALKEATSGKSADEPASTNIQTLQRLGDILERMGAELSQRRRNDKRAETALSRIAALEVRGASELIEQGKWKKLAEELQAIAQCAIDPEGSTRR